MSDDLRALRRDTKERVAAVLAGLGDSRDAVADTLRKGGFTGIAGDFRRCPLVNRLRFALPPGWRVEVVEEYAYILPAGTNRQDKVQLPEPVSEFVRWFDNTMQDWTRQTRKDVAV